jgi:hypothetical protein
MYAGAQHAAKWIRAAPLRPAPATKGEMAELVSGPVLLLMALAALAVIVATYVRDWRRRVRLWRTTPRRLVAPPPAHRVSCVLALAAAVVVGMAASWLRPLAPLVVLVAAFAALLVAHRWPVALAGYVGLALVGEAVVHAACRWLPAPIHAACRWLPAPIAAAPIGLVCAGVLLLWLAGRWRRQLDAGRAWTTTGRLSAAARHVGYAALGLAPLALLRVLLLSLPWAT